MQRGRGARIDNGPVQVRGLRELERDETLAVRDGHGREGQTSILVEPELSRDPHVQVSMRGLVRLVAIIDRRADMAGDWRSRDRRIRDSRGSGMASFLTHSSIPSSALVFGDMELTVLDHRFTSIRVEQVGIDFESDLIEQTLTRVFAVAEQYNIRRGRGRTRVRGGRRSDDDIDNHVHEEIAILRDRDLHFAAQRDVVRRDLEVLQRDGDVRLEVSIHKQHVRAFQIRQRGIHVGFTRSSATGFHRRDVVAKGFITQKHLVHSTIVRNENKHTTSRHNEGLMDERLRSLVCRISELGQVRD